MFDRQLDNFLRVSLDTEVVSVFFVSTSLMVLTRILGCIMLGA